MHFNFVGLGPFEDCKQRMKIVGTPTTMQLLQAAFELAGTKIDCFLSDTFLEPMRQTL